MVVDRIQGKVYKSTLAVGLLADLLGNVVMFQTIPEDSTNAKTRFWGRYVASTAIVVLLGLGGSIVVDALTESAWDKTAWGVALIPMLLVLFATFTLQGVNTILDTTSGQNCFVLVKAALRERKKKCVGCNTKTSSL